MMRTISVVATPAADRAVVRHDVARRDVLTVVVPLAAGTIGALALLVLYVALVSWAQGATHARQLLWDDRYFAGAISVGFGIQIALYTYIRITATRAALATATGVTAAGTGTSTAAMVACCAHHVADALPLIGLSAAAVFLNEYRTPVMGAGLAMNAVGVAVLARLALRQRDAVHASEQRSVSP